MMKDQTILKADKQQKENQKLASASGSADRRGNIDEDARHVVEGLDRRKTGVHGSKVIIEPGNN